MLSRRRSVPSAVVQNLWAVRWINADDAYIALYDTLKSADRSPVGRVAAGRLWNYEFLSSTCRRNLNRIWNTESARHVLPYVLSSAHLDSSLRGRSLGAWMYTEMARMVRLAEDAALIAEECMDEGYTSKFAWRVWRSQTLKDHVQTYGGVGMFRSDRLLHKKTMSPSGFKIHEYRRQASAQGAR